MTQEVIISGKPLKFEYSPSLEVGANPFRRTPIEINGKMVEGININGYDYPPADPGCVLYYPGLPGRGSTIWDRSPYGADGTIYGAIWKRSSKGLWLLDFDGINDYVEIPAAFTQLNFTSEDFSIIARIKVDDVTANRCIFSRGEFNVDGYYFLISASPYLQFVSNQSGASQDSHSAVGSIAEDTWYTVGISRSGTSVIPYIDGVDALSGVGSITDPATSTQAPKIGMLSWVGSGKYDGPIEFLKIIGGVALSASEHLAWHEALK